MTNRAELHLHVYAPALTTDDGRPLAAVEGMERALPGLRLAWRLSDAGNPILLSQRAAWLAESAADGEFGLLCNGDESYPVIVGPVRFGRVIINTLSKAPPSTVAETWHAPSVTQD